MDLAEHVTYTLLPHQGPTYGNETADSYDQSHILASRSNTINAADFVPLQNQFNSHYGYNVGQQPYGSPPDSIESNNS